MIPAYLTNSFYPFEGERAIVGACMTSPCLRGVIHFLQGTRKELQKWQTSSLRRSVSAPMRQLACVTNFSDGPCRRCQVRAQDADQARPVRRRRGRRREGPGCPQDRHQASRHGCRQACYPQEPGFQPQVRSCQAREQHQRLSCKFHTTQITRINGACFMEQAPFFVPLG